MRIKNLTMQSSATSLGASANLSAVHIGHVANFAIQLVWTGSPVGTFKLQASCDEGAPSANTTAVVTSGVSNWTDIADSSVSVFAAGDIMWNVENCGYNFVRVVWARTSGTGSLTVARLNSKGV